MATTSEEKVKIAVTGFGKFHGVETNPTQLVVSRLREILQREPLQDYVQVVHAEVLEVSAEGSLEQLQTMHARLASEHDLSRVVFVHFGVGLAGAFRLERCAWNEATFRCPDERGWQPREACISEAAPYQQPLFTALDLDLIQGALRARGFEVEQSSDPGRFVCNWIYYHSLSRSPGPCVFIHVPPLSHTPEDGHVRFVRAALEVIAQAVQKQRASSVSC